MAISYSRVLPVAVQEFNMRHTFPDFRVVQKRRDEWIRWRGRLTPTPLSKTYDVEIEYSLGSRANVLLPNENWDVDNRPPHTFEDLGLCLYHRDGIGAWRPGMAISQFLMPMIAHWLWCYEMWQITGKWYGEEFPHELHEAKVPN